MKKIYLILLFSFLFFATNAQGLIWAKSIGGTTVDVGNSVTIDASGNVYTTGNFGGTADFDPGPGVYNLTSAGVNDIFINKLDASGNFVWAKSMGGAGNDYGISIAVDATGNVISTGYFNNTSDFDPGPGVYTLTSVGLDDIFISKLDASGNFVWAKNIGGPGYDDGYSISVDVSGNIFTTGTYTGVVDFDPGPGVYNLSIGGGFISKLDVSGNFIWATQLGGIGWSITLDAIGNIYTTGQYSGTMDFDPGPGTYTLTSVGAPDDFVCKLDASGNFVWAKSIGGLGCFVRGLSIVVDPTGNVYTAGVIQGTADFDPGPGIFNITSIGAYYSIFICKLNSAGLFSWAKCMGGDNVIFGCSIALDAANNVYTISNFDFTADFDPGPSVYNLTATGFVDIFISKLDASGNFVWAINLGGGTFTGGSSIAVDASNNIYTTGRYVSTVDFDPGPAVNNLTSFGSYDAFVLKLCQMTTPTITPSGPISFCVGGNVALTSSAANSYSWSNGPTTQSISVSTSGTYSVIVTNSTGCSATAYPISVTVNPLPTITVNNGVICIGNSFTMVPSGANTYTFQGGNAIVSPTANSSYTVVGTSSAGCVSQSFATSTVTVNANPTITINSGTICSGNSFTIIPSGANTYTITGGLTIVSPTINTSYSVTGTSTNGCVSASVISNIMVNALPNLTATTNNTLICVGETVTLSAAGANNYTWNPGGTGTTIVVSPSVTTSYTIIGTELSGCTNSFVITQMVDPCIGLKELNPNGYRGKNDELKIYPNPTDGILNIYVQNNSLATIQITNTLGEILFEEKINAQYSSINIQHLTNGIYFVMVKQGGAVGVVKVVKE